MGAVEALLFMSGEGISLENIADALKTDKKTAKKIVDDLIQNYETEKSGIKIINYGDLYQMCTNPDYYFFIEAFRKTNKKRSLTPAVMETLAIIAYKQPVTKTEIENIRGVNADHTVNKLLEYGLVNEIGRAETPGRPILFGTSTEFLRHFGITGLNELPELPEKYKAELNDDTA